MKRLNPEKLHVQFEQGITGCGPIAQRKYTLTHSDDTAELFLNVGRDYAYDKIGPMRDEVLAEWKYTNCGYILLAYCFVGGGHSIAEASIRYRIFKRELPLALEAIRYGDRMLLESNHRLGKAPIYVHFSSVYPYYNRTEYFGTLEEYE